MEPVFFSQQSDFRKWFLKNHETTKELLVGYYKVGSGKPSITWPQSVDEALCFGWIDGVRKSIDEESYCVRFTPRKPTSIWSAVNIKKIEDLTKKGLMYPAGIKAFSKRKENKSKIYAYEVEPIALSAEFEKIFKTNKKAWSFFSLMAHSYKKTAIHIIMTAKQEATRVSRLNELISASEAGEKMKRLDYQKKKPL